ncbi:MAG: D-2-hydroxyacid dehydrogenase [Rhodospirillales bacterium]|nr:D-2-hydroxyacid dehydrogenase [Rhodospirillales bacterium]
MGKNGTSRIVCRLSAGYPEMIRACEGLDAVTLIEARDQESFVQAIPDARVVVTHNGLYTAEIAAALKTRGPRLEWLHLVTAGWDALLKHGAPSGIPVSNSSGIWTPVVAEHVFAMLLGLVRCLPEMERGRAEGRWVHGEIRGSLSCLRTRTLVILGMGSIGRACARIAKTFEMRVVGVSRTPREEPHADRTVGVERLAEVLPEADALLIAVPLTPATRHLVGARELAALKPSAVLINVARGEVVDEAALVRALAEGKLAGAGLDVFAEEPLPSGHPLWRLKNVVLSPHVGGYGDPHLLAGLAGHFRANLERFLAGKPLHDRVTMPPADEPFVEKNPA